MRNNTVAGMFWRVLPGLGRTLSGVTPWPRLGNNDNNFTAGTGPSLCAPAPPSLPMLLANSPCSEYDFFNFNGGNITVTTLVSPSGNGNGADRPLGFALQIDSLPVQTNYFFPAAAPGQEPPQWDTPDGFVANSIISPKNTFSLDPGAHTLKVGSVFSFFLQRRHR